MSAQVIVVSNEKGGSGKTTIAIHLIVSLMHMGFKVAAIDLDSRQQSLSRYIENRVTTAKKHSLPLSLPNHQVLAPSKHNDSEQAKQDEASRLAALLEELMPHYDYIVADTAGYDSYLGSLICSYADILATPVGDSFLDLDLLGKAQAEDLNKVSAGIYSAMLWEQKIKRAARSGQEMKWFVVRNRLAALDTINNRNIQKVLSVLSKKLGFKVITGFSDRVIFKELFLHGLTLHDAMHTELVRVNVSTVAARQEMREFITALGIKSNLAAA